MNFVSYIPILENTLIFCINFFFSLLQINAQQVTVQTQQQTSQQQKVTYTTQPAIKTQFLTTPISQTQKPGGTQQVQAQIQVQVTRVYTSELYSGWRIGKVTGDM